MAEPYIPAIKDFDFLFKFLFAYFFIQVWGILTGQGRTFEKVPEINRKQIKDIEKKIKKVSETIRNKRQKLRNTRRQSVKDRLEKQIDDLECEEEELINQKHELGKSKRAKLVVDRKVTEEENLSTKRKYLFQFVFLTVSMFIFAFALIGFLEVPGRDVANIAIFIFITASLLKYLFDFSILENGQSYMIILAALSLYVDSFRETAERIASQF